MIDVTVKMSTMKPLVEQAIKILSDLMDVLDEIPEDTYCQPISELSDATLGQHTRHVIEFFQCFLKQSTQQEVNYSLRKRDPNIEQEKAAALDALDDIIVGLFHVQSKPNLLLTYAEEAFAKIPTTVERELLYNIDHAIHHMAILKIGLALVAPQTEIPEDFGIAPSTVQYRKSQEQASG